MNDIVLYKRRGQGVEVQAGVGRPAKGELQQKKARSNNSRFEADSREVGAKMLLRLRRKSIADLHTTFMWSLKERELSHLQSRGRESYPNLRKKRVVSYRLIKVLNLGGRGQMLWSMVSNAAESLGRIRIEAWLRSAAWQVESVTFNKAVLVLWLLLKPD